MIMLMPFFIKEENKILYVRVKIWQLRLTHI